MDTINQKDAERCVVLGTKAEPEFANRFARLCQRKGLTVYQVLQMCCDSFVRYTDDQHSLSPDLEKLMRAFEHMEGWADALNLADPTVLRTIGEATYYIYDADGKKKGCRAVHVTTPFFRDWTETYNIQKILERTICQLMPKRYMRLREMAAEEQCESLLELIDLLIDKHSTDADDREIRETFADNDRSDWGIKPKTDGPYKRHNNKHMDSKEFNFDIIEDNNGDD